MKYPRFAVRQQTDASQEYWESVIHYDTEDDAIRKAGELNRACKPGTAIHAVYDTSEHRIIYRRGFLNDDIKGNST